MHKIFITGCPGSGKSSLGRSLNQLYDIPLYYLDMIYHLPDKTHITPDDFNHRIDSITSSDSWIIDGVYFEYTHKYLNRADTIIYLDIDGDICLKSAIERSGIKRDDFPFIEDKDDEVFHSYIRNFRHKYHDLIMNELSKLHNTDIIILHSYDEINEYINKLKRALD